MQWLIWIVSIVLAAGAGYVVYKADQRRAVPYPWLTALLRSALILLTLLLLLAPAISINKNETQKPVVLFLQDNSASAGIALAKDSATYRKNTQELLEKLSDKYKVVTWAFGNRIQQDSTFSYRQDATDISAALSQAQEFYGLQNLGAVVLATDGRYNQGSNPLFQQLSLRSPVYTVGIGDSTAQKDLRIAQAYANRVVTLNSQFEIRTDIIATLANGYANSVQLTENGSLLGSNSISINSDRYDRSLSFTVKADKLGLHHYVVSAPPAEGEENVVNNRRDIFVEVVDEKKSVLILSAAPHPDINAIKEALTGMETYDITIRAIDKAPADFSAYNVVILHQLPSQRYDVPAGLLSARKPIWYILGGQSNAALLNQYQRAAFLNTNAAATKDAQPTYNTAFNIFTLPPNLQAVIDRLPPLSVQAGNAKASPEVSVLFHTRSDANNPLWMFQQGTPPISILMGEGLWRWRLYEYRYFNQHQVVDECIRQTISFLSANSNERPFQVSLPKYVWSDKESITLNAYLLNANNQQINTPEAQLIIADSAGNKQSYSFERAGSGYRLNIGIRAGGYYTYTGRTTHNGKVHSVSGSFVVESMPLEMMETGADFPLLYALSKKYNGSFVPASRVGALYDSISRNTAIKPVIISNTESVPLVDWKWYFFLILVIAVAEWLLRKYWMAQ
ncbi:MAG: VWA domain-containing protein [Sphingobacteriales bacterium]|nr:MAG: VWA domain-containing protein [Sphingobacteriales bacterium]